MPHRKIISTDTVLYNPDIASDIQCLLCMKSPCHPLSCLCFPTVSSKAADSTYIHVYENRIEYNYPITTVTWDCSCHAVDNVKTIYFDRNQLTEVYAWEGCLCGYDKTVVLRKPCTTCADVEIDQCCGRECLPCVEDAPALVQAISVQKSKRLTELHLNVITQMNR
jgi:hypothetical protein